MSAQTQKVDVLASIPCEWPHHGDNHNGCNQCHGVGSLRPSMEFRFILRGQEATWRRRDEIELGDVDCTELDDDAFIDALLAAGCKVYTNEYLAALAGGAA